MKSKTRVLPVTILLLVILTAAVMLSCKEPSPLFGSWADNRGNSFSFFEEDVFNARVARPGRSADIIDGSYTLLRNVLTFDGKSGITDEEFRVVTEWDIRGNILYFDWTSTDGGSMSMSLYKTSN